MLMPTSLSTWCSLKPRARKCRTISRRAAMATIRQAVLDIVVFVHSSFKLPANGRRRSRGAGMSNSCCATNGCPAGRIWSQGVAHRGGQVARANPADLIRHRLRYPASMTVVHVFRHFSKTAGGLPVLEAASKVEYVELAASIAGAA